MQSVRGTWRRDDGALTSAQGTPSLAHAPRTGAPGSAGVLSLCACQRCLGVSDIWENTVDLKRSQLYQLRHFFKGVEFASKRM